MKMVTKHEVLQAHLKEWLACKDNKKKRGVLNKQLAKSVQMHIKSISRSMKKLQLTAKHTKKRGGRPRTYTAEVDAAIYILWEEMERPCAEVMKPAIFEYVGFLIQHRKWVFSDLVEPLVCSMSESTLRRRVAGLREKHDTVRGKSSTRRSTMMALIPIRKSHTWQGLSPGHTQTDTVVHCGDMLSGDLIFSLGLVDYATYWAEYTVQWNKGQKATWESLETTSARFPFPILEMHPDSGTEFINAHVHTHATQKGIALTRSEPNRKNDNMCIEERNNNLARRHLGYVRLDNIKLVPLAAEVMRLACVMHNHFRPVRRMISKTRVGSKWVRKYEKTAKTAYTRVLESEHVTEEDKKKLRDLHSTLDPITLRIELNAAKDKLQREVMKLRK